jgi:hypothetical protein
MKGVNVEGTGLRSFNKCVWCRCRRI